MQWTPGGVSSDVEDRRGAGFRMGGGGGLGIGGVIILLILGFVFKRDFLSMFMGDVSAPSAMSPAPTSPESDREVQFVSFVLDDVQKTWEVLLPKQTGRPYSHAKLVLYTDYTDSACGDAQSSTGPFYCPGDEKVYIDLGFYRELSQRFGAPGQFAEAYVLAHEIGHHVQKLLGIEGGVRRAQQRDPSAANQLSVGLELQADCLAGVWGHSTAERKIIDEADVQDGMRAAASVGDDRLQKMGRGRVSPETFTHGSSEQRVAAFRSGLDSGNLSACTSLN
jgi:uncharacterized protein